MPIDLVTFCPFPPLPISSCFIFVFHVLFFISPFFFYHALTPDTHTPPFLHLLIPIARVRAFFYFFFLGPLSSLSVAITLLVLPPLFFSISLF
ncbi:hypothetical protein BC940DRAFT_306686 [Gongronella butleri]|nr:hypothetical protein BC940DRAFT_306686 [Gongronella butleri]